MTPDDSDWRLQGQEDHLQGINLVHLQYEQWSESWDHDHCEFCWAKFMPAGTASPEDAGEPLHHQGYTNEDVEGREDHYWWICEECFADFKDRFAWTVKPAPRGNT